jgi:hypothetical protein
MVGGYSDGVHRKQRIIMGEEGGRLDEITISKSQNIQTNDYWGWGRGIE